MLRSWWRLTFAVLLFVVVASCSGGGCSSGCAGCATKPLAGGFPKESVIANAGAVRLTRPGLDFLQGNLSILVNQLVKTSGGVIHFPIPTSHVTKDFTIFKFNLDLCPDGADPNSIPSHCIADIDIGHAKLTIDAVTNYKNGDTTIDEPGVLIAGTLPVRVQDLPIGGTLGSASIGVGVGDCSTGKPTNNGQPGFDYKEFPVTIFLPFAKETSGVRDGFTKLDAANAVIDPQIGSGDLAICKDCTALPVIGQPICNAVFNFIRDVAFGSLIGGIKDQLRGAIAGATCTKADATTDPVCPLGSHSDAPDGGAGGTCVYDADPKTCVPIMLGTDGHIDLGGLFASISPGTTGGLDFALAAGGGVNPAPGKPLDNGHTPNGLTLAMIGGALPQPKATCVPIAANPLPTQIPIPDELLGDAQPGWPAGDPGPHVGIALAGRFLNYAVGNAYNSGLLCLGVSTEQFQQLNTGLLSVLIPSIKKLTFERKSAAAAIATRPQAAPQLTLGGGTDLKKDPLLRVTLPKLDIDFYVWSYDRFVRAFTLEADVTVPVNLQTKKDAKNPNGGLLPVLGDIGISNPKVSNNDLLTDDPASIGNALGSVLGGIAGPLLGSIKPIDLGSALKSTGLSLTIPDGGIRKLTKGTDDFLAIFADLAAAAPATPFAIDTSARLLEKTVHTEAMTLATAAPETMPTLHVMLGSPADDGTRAVEYAWKIDDGTWSAWSRERDVTVRHPSLFLQGKHTLSVSARVVGQPDSEDPTPATIPFTIDALPPFVSLKAKGDGVAIDAWDLVSDALVARVRRDDGAWSAWMPLEDVGPLAANGSTVDVEVKDEEGNVGTAREALVRGRNDSTLGAAAGCNCGVTGTTPSGGLTASLGALAALALFALRRRGARMNRASAALGLGAICAVAASSQGCACGDSGSAETPKTGCGADCNTACRPALAVGIVGAYTSVARASDGTVWVAGYNDAVLSTDGTFLYGDLVVGKYDSGKKLVQWASVDGLPPARTDGTCPDYDPKGWRGGEGDTGDDVGLWTSLQLGEGNQPIVTYYDATHGALKFASYDGAHWSTHTVLAAPGADIGRYAKMLVVGGKPVVAFLAIDKGAGGHLRSKVSIARAALPTPRGPSDWTLEDAIVDESGPCRASFCDGDQACVKSTGACEPKAKGCAADCGSGSACVTLNGAATCEKVAQATDIETYPNALGDYVSLANGPQGLGLVVYDRIHGNLIGASDAGGRWTATILDGETGSRKDGTAVDTGDTGIGAALAIGTNGDWHVSYVNGITGALLYQRAPGGKPGAAVVVDDGTGIEGQAFTDGTHFVGDDSSIRVDANGAVTILYQDATAGTLRIATASGGKFHVAVVPQTNRFAGFFPRFVPDETGIANFFRQTDPATKDISGDVAIVTP